MITYRFIVGRPLWRSACTTTMIICATDRSGCRHQHARHLSAQCHEAGRGNEQLRVRGIVH